MDSAYQIKVTAEDGASKVFNDVAANARKAQADVERGTLQTLKESIGSRSQFKDVIETLRGGAYVAGLSLLGRSLSDVTGKAVELNTAFVEGKKSAGEINFELAKSLPIIGSFVTAGQNIRELFTGEQAAIARQLAGAERMNQLLRERVKIIDDGRVANEKAMLDLNKRVVDNMMKGMKDPMRSWAEAQRKGANDLLGLRDERGAIGKAIEAGPMTTVDGKEMPAKQRMRDIDARLVQVLQMRDDIRSGKERRNDQPFYEENVRLNAEWRQLSGEVKDFQKSKRSELITKYGEMREVGKGLAIDAAGFLESVYDGMKGAIEKEAQDKLAKLDKRSAEDRIDESLRKVFSFEDQFGPDFFEALPDPKTAQQRIDRALGDYFSFQDDSDFSDLFDKGKKRGDGARFSAATDSRGSGIAAAGRGLGNRDLTLDVAKDSNKTLKAQKEILSKGLEEIARKVGEVVGKLGAGYSGAGV